MCTVSLIYTDDLVRLACNRDESITRPDAFAPQLMKINSNRVVMPIDPKAGGTWIAMASSGLIFSLINHNPTPLRNASYGRISRGAIIPNLSGCNDLEEARIRIKCMDLNDYAPFRLLVSDRSQWFQASWDRRWLHVVCSPHSGVPVMMTSSGLGDELVDLPRRRLFNSMIHREHDLILSQEAFHDHHWPEAGWLSVKMMRDDARTVSQTIIELTDTNATMRYTTVPGGHTSISRLQIETSILV